MDSYFIFAIVLTLLYILYYAVVIVHDLYGKKGTEKPGEEVFELDPEDITEESIDVSENETGFSVGNEKYDTEAQPAAGTSQETDADQDEEIARKRFERLKAKAEAQLEDTERFLSDPLTAEEMYKAMVSGGRLDNRPAMAWKPVKDRL